MTDLRRFRPTRGTKLSLRSDSEHFLRGGNCIQGAPTMINSHTARVTAVAELVFAGSGPRLDQGIFINGQTLIMIHRHSVLEDGKGVDARFRLVYPNGTRDQPMNPKVSATAEDQKGDKPAQCPLGNEHGARGGSLYGGFARACLY